MPVDYDLKGKVIALTGAVSGIGYETALLLARQGAHISICGLNSTALSEKAASIEAVSTGRVLSAVVDVHKDDTVRLDSTHRLHLR